MTIANFVPELWDAAIQLPFEAELVFGQPNVVNRKYEGTIAQQGDTVHVSSIERPTISKYDKSADLVVEDLTDTSTDLLIDQGDYFAFRVNDVDKVQAAGDFESPATQEAGVGLKESVDSYIAGLFEPAALPANKLGRVTIVDGKPELATVGQIDAYTVLVKLSEKLNKKSVPKAGRYAAIPAEMLSCLLLDDRFVNLERIGNTDGLLNGQVGRAAGFDILVSNNIPTVGGSGANKNDQVVIAGIADAVSFANQINQVEAFREQKRFADVVRGLNIYGAKVFRPEAIATATAVFAPPAPAAG